VFSKDAQGRYLGCKRACRRTTWACRATAWWARPRTNVLPKKVAEHSVLHDREVVHPLRARETYGGRTARYAKGRARPRGAGEQGDLYARAARVAGLVGVLVWTSREEELEAANAPESNERLGAVIHAAPHAIIAPRPWTAATGSSREAGRRGARGSAVEERLLRGGRGQRVDAAHVVEMRMRRALTKARRACRRGARRLRNHPRSRTRAACRAAAPPRARALRSRIPAGLEHQPIARAPSPAGGRDTRPVAAGARPGIRERSAASSAGARSRMSIPNTTAASSIGSRNSITQYSGPLAPGARCRTRDTPGGDRRSLSHCSTNASRSGGARGG